MNKVYCPVCNKVMEDADPQRFPDIPFCSARSKLIDLGRWLKEGYAIPSESDLDDETMDD